LFPLFYTVSALAMNALADMAHQHPVADIAMKKDISECGNRADRHLGASKAGNVDRSFYRDHPIPNGSHFRS
jgi:hypothetical protein